jgi:transcription antitermination factor NusG
MSTGPMRIVGVSTEGDVLTCLLDGFEGTFSLESQDLLALISSILGVSGAPLSVPGELLQKVADELAGIKTTRPRPFSAGQKVSVRRGPFAELMGIVRELDHEGERAMVKIDMLGKEHHLELGYEDLKVA